MGAGGACAVRARAVVAGIGAVLTLTHGVITTRAAAICAVAHRAGVRAVRAATCGAFVVVHSLLGAMLAVHVAVVQVVNVVAVQYRFVSTSRAVGVTVLLSLGVLHRCHGASLTGGPSHAYIRSSECRSQVGVGAELVIHGGDLRCRWTVVVVHDRRSWRYDCCI